MSFKATIDVGGKTFELVHCESILEQKTDSAGRPSSGVHGGHIWIVVEGTADDTFGSWVTDPTKKQDGTITFFKIDQDSKFKEIEFKGAYLTYLIESFITDEDASDPKRLSGDELNFDYKPVEIGFEILESVQKRTNMSYLILCRLSAEKIKIDGVDHDNKW
ncbi:MAG: hypothetical protein JST47_13375 [Bacteroidetes bacterium]|nr:hypothetical protein [Bacteroidota bacterium]MBS1974025.1 hypothetical protein [Bacteroidota bacterium]